MAFAARLGPLIGELVEALTLTSAKSEPDKFKKHTESALRILKPNQYLRTNQFEVEKNLNGLEERFRVNGREALADALAEKRAILEQTPSKWHPEILFLLLDISDQPTFNSKLSDLDLLISGVDAPEPQFRWEEIAKEDGWEQDADIWERPIKYSDSSDDEDYGEDATSESGVSSASSDGSAVETRATSLIIHPENIAEFNLVRRAQEWRNESPPTDSSGHARKVPVTEFHIAREVMFMLQGLDTTLFGNDGSVDPAFQMAHLKWETHKALISHFSEAGRQLYVLRRFIAQSQSSSHLQVFHDSVASRLRDFDKAISEIQRPFVAPKDHAVVSLLSIKGKLAPSLEPLCSLSSIVAQVLDVPNSGAFRYLELLFNEASLAQLAGRLAVYEFFARIFVECFNVYLRPIRLWMDEGRLLPGDKIFFVSEAPTKVPLPKIWRDQYRLRQTKDGNLHAPKFLQPAALKIFNAGKNIVVLKQLRRFAASTFKSEGEEPPLDYDVICPAGFELAPFSDLFDAAFDRWIQSKYNATSSTLRNALFEACGLWTALDTLQYLYFMSDGAATESFSNNLFGKLDALLPGWSNRYTLTSTAQEAFSLLLDSTRLSMNVSPNGLRLSALEARDSVGAALPTIKVNYRLAWPVQMILSEESVSHYQAIFTLLLQLRRALYVLHKQKLLECYWTDDENWDERSLYYSQRSNLLWFCTTIQTYFATLVLAPNSSKMRHDLTEAHDVDAMITIHAAFLKRVIDEACLGSRLTPIRQCLLDVLDLAIKLEQAESSNAKKQAEEMQELSLLSPAKEGTPASKGARYVRDSDDEDSDEELPQAELDKPYVVVLREIKSDFDRHLRFICGGLRSVARASSDAQSAKWDILAEMLQTGSRDER
ncbi:Fc.00g052810.m01.CDS01 [Cosmosporella sp. VM-42]